MAMDWAQVSLSLDIGTLFVIAICVTLVLGLLLLCAWTQERIPALGWWGAAYLIGAFSGALWRFGDLTGSELPAGIANILLFVAVGMIWSAARLFHGRRVRWGLMFLVPRSGWSRGFSRRSRTRPPRASWSARSSSPAIPS